MASDARIRRMVLGVVLVATAAACTESNDSGGSPTQPSPTTSMNLAGTWSGTFGTSIDPDPDRVSWTATQSGVTVTGSATLAMTGHPELRLVTGTMAGTISGTQVSLTFTLPPGVFVPHGGPSTCGMTGTATATPTDTSIAAPMTRTFTASCVGTVSKGLTDTVELMLTKQ